MKGRMLAAALTAATLTGCTHNPPEPTALSGLLDSIEKRLDIAEPVALYKWDSGQPVEAPARERQVIANALEHTAALGLHDEWVAGFFADQIEANKMLQYSALYRWRLDGHAPDTPRLDLGTQLRTRLDTLRDELLVKLASFEEEKPQDCEQSLAESIDERRKDRLRTLALIRASRTLCSGL